MRVQTPRETFRMITCPMPWGCLTARTAAVRAMSNRGLNHLLYLTMVLQYLDPSKCASLILLDTLKWNYYFMLSAYADNTYTSMCLNIYFVLFNIWPYTHTGSVVIYEREEGLAFTWKMQSSIADVVLVLYWRLCWIWCDSTCVVVLAENCDVLQGKRVVSGLCRRFGESCTHICKIFTHALVQFKCQRR